ncbi:MAG: C40 family peptidase, partial [Phycisphaerae bacterium]|nr:C40 family peptidase [Phycisphaerae bacterium]MDW8263640.1 C40 family peptidase [Phycisphaerales bacterium]
EIRRGVRMSDPPELRHRRFWENLARQIEPELQGQPARLDVYLRFFEREIIRDTRLFACKLAALRVDGVTRVVGLLEYQEQIDALHRLLETLQLGPIDSSIELAPSSAVRDSPFAVVAAERSFLRRDPTEKSEVVNEALRGEPVFLLDLSADHRRFLCHSADGYVGWITVHDVERIPAERLTAILNPGPPRRPDLIETAIADAMSRIGAAYVWGGRSDAGVDCSGLVQRAFAAAGVHLPRDAEQQALAGRLVATRGYRDALRRGDILFFLGRRGFVAHTGIYLGEGRFVESANEGVKISMFNDEAERTRRDESFCFAKRVID